MSCLSHFRPPPTTGTLPLPYSERRCAPSPTEITRASSSLRTRFIPGIVQVVLNVQSISSYAGNRECQAQNEWFSKIVMRSRCPVGNIRKGFNRESRTDENRHSFSATLSNSRESSTGNTEQEEAPLTNRDPPSGRADKKRPTPPAQAVSAQMIPREQVMEEHRRPESAIDYPGELIQYSRGNGKSVLGKVQTQQVRIKLNARRSLSYGDSFLFQFLNDFLFSGFHFISPASKPTFSHTPSVPRNQTQCRLFYRTKKQKAIRFFLMAFCCGQGHSQNNQHSH